MTGPLGPGRAGPLGPGRARARPSLDLEYPRSLGVFEKYDDAQKAVDYLSDHEFPVQNCLIVGTELKQVERITGRLTRGRVIAATAGSGAWFGLFVGLLLGLFVRSNNFVEMVSSATLIGLLWGALMGVVGYAATGGRRDFTSVTQVVATRYEVLTEHRVADQARELLGKMPGAAPNPFG
ncbi:MAG: hypothetical protein LBQ06_08095 [Frankiaceae bacterium]|jgi:hypothetical protein|nr:hypothetical protein [Frankiaceae bacterium]